jgi:hypothetical protein
MQRSSIQRAASWVMLTGFVLFGLQYLNGAVFSAWMSGGPPNPHPLGWERRAIGQLSLSLASFVLAIGSYRLIVTLPAWRRLPVALVLLGIVLLVTPYIGRFLLQDKCLDSGGQWNNLTLECTTT